MALNMQGTEATEINSNSRHNILTIPHELLERIADYVDLSDLFALRLINKECTARVLRVFKKRYFAGRAFLIYSEDSLRNLLDLTRHEDFGPAVRKLALCVDELPEMRDSNHQYYRNHGTLGEDVLQTTRMRLRSQATTYVKYLEKQETSKEQEDDLCRLTTIFSEFRRSGNNPDIAVTSIQDWHDNVSGLAVLEELTGEDLVPPKKPSWSISVVLNALALSCMKPRSLSIVGPLVWSIYSLVTSKCMRSAAASVFENLTQLDLSWTGGFNYGSYEVAKVVDLLTHSKNFKDLRLALMNVAAFGAGTVEELLISRILRTSFPALTQLDLNFVLFNFQDLVTFVRKNPKLDKVWLDCVDVYNLRPEDFGLEHWRAECKLPSEVMRLMLLRSTERDVLRPWQYYRCDHGRGFEDDEGQLFGRVDHQTDSESADDEVEEEGEEVEVEATADASANAEDENGD